MKSPITKVCVNCDNSFTPYRPTSKYCGEVCKRKASNERWKQWKQRRIEDGSFRDIINTQQQRYREENPNYARNMHLISSHSITYEQFELLASAIDYKCQICSVQPERLHVDHDHSCCSGRKSCGRCIRGLLCMNCNTALGNFKDNIENVQAALKYLQSWSLPTMP